MDISINGGKLVGLASDTNNTVVSVQGDNPVISVAGVPWGPPAKTDAAPAAPVATSPFFDKWTDQRVWQTGDRWPSDMEQIFKPQWFKNLPNNAVEPTTTAREVRQKFTLTNGMNIDLTMPTVRTVYELLRGDGRTEVAIHLKGASGKVRVELAGASSGGVTGGAQVGTNGGPAGQTMEGNLDSFSRTLDVSGTLDVYLRLDSGDTTVLFVVTPL